MIFESFDTRLRRGVFFCENGDQDGAEKIFRELTVDYSENFVGWLNLGILLASRQKWSDGLRVLDRVIVLAPRNADAIALRGTCLLSLGGPRDAEDSFEQALSIDPNNVQALLGKGDIALSAGRFSEAATAIRSVFARITPNPDLILKYGFACEQSGDLPEAIEAYRRFISHGEAPIAVLLALGRSLLTAGRAGESLETFETALKIDPRCVEALFGRGVALESTGQAGLAEESYSQAVYIDETHVAGWINKGALLGRSGRHEEAKNCLKRVILLDPENPLGFLNLGICHQALEEYDSATECYESALRLDPNCAEAALNMGAIQQKLMKSEDAVSNYELAGRLRPDWAEPHYNLGVARHERKFYSEAINSYDLALSLDPDHIDARLNRSLAHLIQGNFGAGWTDFEWRLRSPRCSTSRMPTPPLPRWDGELLVGKRLMVIAEQGFGDSLQFFRFVPLIKTVGAEVSLVVPARLLRLFESNLPDVVTRLGDNFLDDWFNCDYYCFLMSLPAQFGVSLADVEKTGIPYLRSAVRLNADRPTPISGLSNKVGIVWRAGDKSTVKGRDAPLQAFETLISPHWTLLSLQKDTTEEEGRWLSAMGTIPDLSDLQSDFSDAAALIEEMDVVITVDTSVAHLAGAMGKETWILLPFAADWRWLEARDDSPWYRSVRLFRQSEQGRWTDVLERVRAALLDRFHRPSP